MVGDMGELFSAESSATTEIEIIKSRMILGDTVDKFNLTTVVTPNYMPLIGKGLARLQGEQNSLSVSRFNIPSYALGIPHTLEVIDSEQKRSNCFKMMAAWFWKAKSASRSTKTVTNSWQMKCLPKMAQPLR